MSTIDTISVSKGLFGKNASATKSDQRTDGRNILVRLVNLLELWQERRRSRTVLAKLTDRELADIGISKAQADFEASRPFWASSVNRMR